MTTELPELEFEASGAFELVDTEELEVDTEEIGVALEPVAGVGLPVEGSTEGVDDGAWVLEDMRIEKKKTVCSEEKDSERENNEV
jgi:hypothetical protein